jgi:hypothetical protein
MGDVEIDQQDQDQGGSSVPAVDGHGQQRITTEDCATVSKDFPDVKINGLVYECEVSTKEDAAVEIRLLDEIDREYRKTFKWENVEEWFEGRDDLAEYLVEGGGQMLLRFLLAKCLTFDQSRTDTRKKVLQIGLPSRRPVARQRKPPEGKSPDSPKSTGVAQRSSRSVRAVKVEKSPRNKNSGTRRRAMTECHFEDPLIFRDIQINGTDSNVTVLRWKKSEAITWHDANEMLSYQQTEGVYPDKRDAIESSEKPGVFFIVAWEMHKTYAHWFAWEYLVGLLRSSSLLAQPPAEIEGTSLGTSAASLSEGGTIKLVEPILTLLMLDRDSADSRKRFLAHSIPKQPFKKKQRVAKPVEEDAAPAATETTASLMDIVSSGPAKETKWGALKGGFRGNLKTKYFDALEKDSTDLLALRELGYLFNLDGDVELSAQLLHRCASQMTSPNDMQHSKVWLTLARSHLGCCWTQSSTEKDDVQLHECNRAYQQTLKFLDNVTKPQIWYESAIAQMMVGALEPAAGTCALMLVEFPAFEHVVSVIHTAGMLLFSLGKSAGKSDDGTAAIDVGMLERAIAYLSHISSSPLPPYTSYHYDFFIARIKDLIQGDGGQQKDLYEGIYDRLKADEEIMQAVEDEDDPWCLADDVSVEQWLLNEMLWWNVGAFCATQSHFLLAIEFFHVSVIVNEPEPANPDMLCWLADAYLGCGPSFKEKAKMYAMQALELDPESDFASTVYDFVNEPPPSTFEARAAVPLRELLLPYQEQEEEAASLMQGLFRVKKAKEKVEKKREGDKKKADGAAKIQGVFRGKKGREKASDVRARIHGDLEQQLENKKKHKSATALQKVARARKAKKKVSKKRKDKEEKCKKKVLSEAEAKIEKQVQDESAIKVQAIMRGKRGRGVVEQKKAVKTESAASKIQKRVRGKKARANVAAKKVQKKEEGLAACKIQSAFRAKKGRKKFRRKRARREKARLKSQKEAEESQQDSFGFSTSKELSDNSLQFRSQIPRLKVQTDSFLEVENSPFETQKLKSLKKLKRHGFPSTVVTSTYIRHWESLLTALSCIFPESKTIRRRAAEVMSLSPGITEDEALCALAACYGVVGEAVGRLRNDNFKHESMSICSILDIKSYAFKMENNSMGMSTLATGSPNTLLIGGGFSLSSPTSPYKRRGLSATRWSQTPGMSGSTSAPELGFSSRKSKKLEEKGPKKPLTSRAQQKWCSKASSGKSSSTRRRDLDAMIKTCIDSRGDDYSNQDLDGTHPPAFSPFSFLFVVSFCFTRITADTTFTCSEAFLPSIDQRGSSPPPRARSPDNEVLFYFIHAIPQFSAFHLLASNTLSSLLLQLRLFSPLQLTQTSYENATAYTR